MADVKHRTPKPSGMVRNAVSKMLEKGRHNMVNSSIQSVDSEDHEGHGGVSLLDNDSEDDFLVQPVQSPQAVMAQDMDTTPKASVAQRKIGNAPTTNFAREFRRKDKKRNGTFDQSGSNGNNGGKQNGFTNGHTQGRQQGTPATTGAASFVHQAPINYAVQYPQAAQHSQAGQAMPGLGNDISPNSTNEAMAGAQPVWAPLNNHNIDNQQTGIAYQHMGIAQVQPGQGFMPNEPGGHPGVSSPVGQPGYPVQYALMSHPYAQPQMVSAADSNAFAQSPHAQPAAGVTQLASGQFYYAYGPTFGGPGSNVQPQGGQQTSDAPKNEHSQTVNDSQTGLGQSQATKTPSHTTKSSVMNPYNQTEPRNFAPRADSLPAQPPPPFMIGTAYAPSTNGTQAGAVAGSGIDPFSPAGNDERAVVRIPNHHSGYETPNENYAVMPHMPISGPPPPEVRAARSAQLNRLTDGPSGLPPAEVALHPDNFPFIESCSQATASDAGVVKIKNIPYITTHQEIKAFLGRNSKILNDAQEPVHIIMERISGKTQEAYVEFFSQDDAIRAVQRFNQAVQRGRPPRIADRPVDVELSGQASMMRDLFPLAAGVVWRGAEPEVQPPVEGKPWNTFKGFVTTEEMAMLVKLVEMPQRAQYLKHCPQRPYECMISTLRKLPWQKSDCITIHQRWAVYNATIRLIELLRNTIQRNDRDSHIALDQRLLKRLVNTAMLCPGFSVLQKDNIAFTAGMDEMKQREFNQPRFPDLWTHQLSICPKPGVPLDVLEWYIAIIREETTRFVNLKAVSERTEIINKATKMDSNGYFGFLWHEIGFPTGGEYDNMTLKQAMEKEMRAVEESIKRALYYGYQPIANGNLKQLTAA
ncbi:hypothetical protein QBC32DRAFT_382225 [Pseudoneurospora amorphoporcata]|uniref:RRM domain-containing protein n=1 Tax=Pseudoneurospora amorphoporcata TaxID=241081 RepID=A0AAN6NNC3_9PEZI|nr:hypothetical protein QBC32DRAFT_382225 [Pseudoneurospora amorphoporcata]